jgi:hypothetical protein
MESDVANFSPFSSNILYLPSATELKHRHICRSAALPKGLSDEGACGLLYLKRSKGGFGL